MGKVPLYGDASLMGDSPPPRLLGGVVLLMGKVPLQGEASLIGDSLPLGSWEGGCFL